MPRPAVSAAAASPTHGAGAPWYLAHLATTARGIHGFGFLECVWEGDFEPHEVRVSIIPLAAWEADFSAAEPLDLMGEDIGGGELYDSLLGIGRVGRGTTAVYFVGDRAILTAVRTGEDGSLAVDRSFAVDLGQRVVDQL